MYFGSWKKNLEVADPHRDQGLQQGCKNLMHLSTYHITALRRKLKCIHTNVAFQRGCAGLRHGINNT